MLHVADPLPPGRRPMATKLGSMGTLASSSSSSLACLPPRHHSDLLPGLPDDVAFLCLIRVPRASHPVCRQVSKSWRQVMLSAELYEERVKQCITEPWLYVRAVSRGTPRQWWQALDPKTATWQAVPVIPGCIGRLSGAGSAVLGGCLYVVGGMSCNLEQPIAQVHRYDPCSNVWRDMAPLLVARGYAAVEALGDCLYVAGGNGARLCELRSVETFKPQATHISLLHRESHNSYLKDSPEDLYKDSCTAGSHIVEIHKVSHKYRQAQQKDGTTMSENSGVSEKIDSKWQFVAPMVSDMARYDSTVCNGRLYVTEGWHWPFHFSPRGFVYTAEKDEWHVMPLGMSEGWTGPSCTLQGFVCVVAHLEATIHRLEVYDTESDEWHSLTGDPLPKEISPNFVVEAVGNDVYVVGDGLMTAVGHVSNLNSRGGNVSWSLLPPPEGLQDRYVDTGCLLDI